MQPSLLSAAEVRALVKLIEEHVAGVSANEPPKRGGIRDVMARVTALRAAAEHPSVRGIVDKVLGRQAFVVRSTLFDKTPVSNWKVPWHQDLTIAVSERIDSEGYGPWSVKEGVTHVQPPSEVLKCMITVRVHLDACPETNGALRVMPGSHVLGRIDQNEAPRYVDEAKAVTCAIGAGGALVMRPLLLHASSASVLPGHRRVLHFDFACCSLPSGMHWHLNRHGSP